jgi:hypothetical protein
MTEGSEDDAIELLVSNPEGLVDIARLKEVQVDVDEAPLPQSAYGPNVQNSNDDASAVGIGTKCTGTSPNPNRVDQKTIRQQKREKRMTTKESLKNIADVNSLSKKVNLLSFVVHCNI